MTKSNHLGDISIDGRKIIKTDFKYNTGLWIGFICLRIWPLEGSCKHGNESSPSIKGGKIRDQLSDC